MSTTPPAPSDSSSTPNPAASKSSSSLSSSSSSAGTLLPNDTYPFPREFFFPPFFTRQTNLTTHHAQLTKWSTLLLSYCRHHRLFRVSLSPDTLPFHNPRINRRLAVADIKSVVDFMKKDGRAEYVPTGTTSTAKRDSEQQGGGSGSGSGGGGDEAFVYWRTPEAWGSLIEGWVDETGQRGSVLTVYELREGEGTRGTEIWGMDGDVLVKALGMVVKRGKAQIFQSGEDSLGVKFF